MLIIRPRGWHLTEEHFQVDDQTNLRRVVPTSGSIFSETSRPGWRKGRLPTSICPRFESHLEARLWNESSCMRSRRLGVPNGTIRATVLIETILAAFEMDEILWELRDHSLGLNCGRWDHIFSFIKTFKIIRDS